MPGFGAEIKPISYSSAVMILEDQYPSARSLRTASYRRVSCLSSSKKTSPINPEAEAVSMDASLEISTHGGEDKLMKGISQGSLIRTPHKTALLKSNPNLMREIIISAGEIKSSLKGMRRPSIGLLLSKTLPTTLRLEPLKINRPEG